MKILYVVFHNYADLPYHTREWVEAAVALGHEVTVLTSVDPEFLRKIGWKNESGEAPCLGTPASCRHGADAGDTASVPRRPQCDCSSEALRLGTPSPCSATLSAQPRRDARAATKDAAGRMGPGNADRLVGMPMHRQECLCHIHNLRVHQVPFPHAIPRPWRYWVLERRFRRELDRAIRAIRPEAVYERFSILSGAGSAAAQHHGIPYGVELNGILDQELPGGWRNWLKRKIQQAVERRVFAGCAAVIAVTGKIKEWVVKDYGVPPERCAIIPNGVNPERFSPRDKASSRKTFGAPEDAFVVGFLGSLFPWQNLPMLVESAPRLIEAIPNFFCMIGGGQEPILSQLRGLVKEKGLTDRFLLPGQVPWDDAAAFISCFDVAVAPIWQQSSEYSFSPLKLAAYMACARPVLATAAPGIKELLDQSGAGQSFALQDRAAMAKAIVDFAKMPTAERQAYGRRGREYVIKHLSWQSLVKKTLDMVTP